MSIAEKLVTVAENVPKVFNAGQLSVISQSEALKGCAQGEGVTIKDISPVEHNMAVKLSGLPPIEAGGTTIPITRPYAFEDDEAQTGMTWTVADDGTITIEVDGNLTDGPPLLYIAENLLLSAGEYTLSSVQSVTSNPDYSDSAMWAHYIMVFNGNPENGGNQIKNVELPTYTTTDVTTTSRKTTLTFTLTEETTVWIAYNYGSAGVNMGFVPDTITTVIKPHLKADVTYISADYSDVKVQRLGKNLFDPSKFLAGSGWKKIDDGVYYGNSAQLYAVYKLATNNPIVSGVFKENTRYTISFLYRTTENDNGITFVWKYTDGTSHTTYFNNKSDTLKLISRTSKAGKTVEGIYVSYGFTSTSYFKDVQLEEGVAPSEEERVTEFEPYNCTEYTANADGTVDGIKSLYPSMTLTSDTEGVIVTAEYIKDIDKAFDERLAALEAAIVNNE